MWLCDCHYLVFSLPTTNNYIEGGADMWQHGNARNKWGLFHRNKVKLDLKMKQLTNFVQLNTAIVDTVVDRTGHNHNLSLQIKENRSKSAVFLNVLKCRFLVKLSHWQPATFDIIHRLHLFLHCLKHWKYLIKVSRSLANFLAKYFRQICAICDVRATAANYLTKRFVGKWSDV